MDVSHDWLSVPESFSVDAMLHDVEHDELQSWDSESVPDIVHDVLHDALQSWDSESVPDIVHDVLQDVLHDVLSESVYVPYTQDVEQLSEPQDSEQDVLQVSVFVSVRDVEQSWAAHETVQDCEPHNAIQDCVDVLIVLVFDIDVHDLFMSATHQQISAKHSDLYSHCMV